MSETQHGIYYIEEIAAGSYKIYEQRAAAMYLVCGSERACLIDTAYGLCDLKKLTAELTDLPVTVVNTHAHEDHVFGNHRFYGGRVCLHPADKQLYNEMTAGYAGMLELPWVQESFGEFIKGIDIAAVRFPQTEDIREGDVIDLGGKALEVVEMPGHTPGSVLLIDRTESICYSGDSIMEQPWLFLPESLSEEVYLGSLRHAREVLGSAGIERIYNGHFSYKPLTVPQLDNMIAGMESIVSGSAAGEPFTNDIGSGIKYAFGEWSIFCREKS